MFEHMDKEYREEIGKLKGRVRSHSKIPISKWVLRISAAIAVLGLIALLFVPEKYRLIINLITGGALLVGIGSMLYIGRNSIDEESAQNFWWAWFLNHINEENKKSQSN